jgi:hypothetical protein
MEDYEPSHSGASCLLVIVLTLLFWFALALACAYFVGVYSR